MDIVILDVSDYVGYGQTVFFLNRKLADEELEKLRGIVDGHGQVMSEESYHEVLMALERELEKMEALTESDISLQLL